MTARVLLALVLLGVAPRAQVPGAPLNARLQILNPPVITPGSCTTTLSAGANVASAIASAAAGAVICLNSGSYGQVTLGTYTKSPRVTIQSTTALGASLAGMYVGGSSAPNGLTFSGLTWTNDVQFDGPVRNFTIRQSAFGTQAMLIVETGTYNANNVLFDANTHGALNAGPDRPEGRISIRNGSGNPSGVAITNSVFGPGGCSDGVQTAGNTVTIGPGNLFTGIVQGSCNEHVDAIQGYSAANTVIVGNFFVGNTVAFGFYDGEDGMVIRDNVVNGAEVCDLGTLTNLLMIHNTFRTTQCRIGGINFPGGGSGLITDNIFHGGSIVNGSSAFGGTRTHNQFATSGAQSGTNNIIGAPTYTGGSAPATWAGWQLTSGSIGFGVASDTGDMGAATFGP